ncbi:MAG: GGDEF domain-containing protein [Oscillospiraceae bacterium]|nr:GGDEF domain-containing protein [Oscillospiraceae bacterium]
MLDYTYIYILTSIALVALMTIVRRSSHLEKRKNLFFILAAYTDMLVLLGYVGRDLSEQHKIMLLAQGSNLIIYMCAPLTMFWLILASTKKTDKLLCFCGVLEAISIIIAVSSPFTELFFTVSDDVVYSRGPLYLYNEILGILFVIVWAWYSYREFRYIEFIDKVYLSEVFVFQLAAIILQGLNSTYKVIYIGGAFDLALYYAFIIEVYGKYDKMTGLRNRLYYNNFVNSIKPAEKYAVILFDGNGLKNINDTLGHEAGDKFLCTIASAIASAVGKKGSSYRVGGDEFVSIVRSDNTEVLERIVADVHKKLEASSEKLGFECTVSSGVAVHLPCESFNDTFNRADMKMYEDKNRYYISTGKEKRK